MKLYINGRIFTGELPLAEAFAVENGRFVVVGSNEEILALRDATAEVVDLGGNFVCAGFNDSHMHLIGYGGTTETCDLAPHTQSLADMSDALRRFIAEKNIESDSWVRGRGWNQDYFSDFDGLPTRVQLDAISTEHPICVTRCCGHCLAVNSRALELLGIDGTQPQPDGGHYDLDESGKPTGVFRDAAMGLVSAHLPQPTRDDVKRMILAACSRLNSFGVTSSQTDDLCTFDIDYHEVIAAYKELEAEDKLTVRVYEQSQFTDVETLRGFIEEGYNTGVGGEFFRIGPLKLLGDGSLGARTAFLRDEYADAPGEKGLALFTQEQFDEMVGLAHRSGMQIAIHAIGDGILDRILSAYEKAFAAHPRDDHRSGIVHAQLTHRDQLEKMRSLGLHAYAQTIFIDYDAHIVEERVGSELAATSYAFHSMKEMGMHVSNGTDCPVESPNPMRGIQCAVTRQPLDDSLPPYRPEEAMSIAEALRSYTVESAYASFDENDKGRITAGLLADFVLLDSDPFEVNKDKLHTIKVLETFVGGRSVYKA